MAFEVEFERHSTYIHVSVTGDNTRESVIGYMEKVREECEKEECYHILVEEKLEGPRFKFMDMFTMIIDGVRNYVGVFKRFAYVDESIGEMGKIAETVAVNRGIPVAVFNSVEDARNWLLQD